MRKLVLDTNVVISAFLWTAAPRQLLDAARDEQVELVTSEPLLRELEDTLGRSKFAARLRASFLSVEELLFRYRKLTTVVQAAEIAPTAVDPDDDVVLGTALSGRADAIVSGDAHLLSLITFQHIPILNVARAIEAVRREHGL